MRSFLRFLGASAIGLCALAVVGGAGVAFVFHKYGKELPDYRQLARYEPPTVTRIHAGDGKLLQEYAKEKRVFVPIDAIPERIKNAFVAAEDKNFYNHVGIDPIGIGRAVIDNVERIRDNRRPQGASTITQQVAKNFLLTNELSFERKIKEAILALRIDQTFSKDHILELYLNQIFLGLRSYGVAAAALNYFDKSLDELTISEAAFLAGLPKAPSRYDPRRRYDEAIARRNYVIGRMLDDGYITAAEANEAYSEELVVRRRAPTEFAKADFFTEEVRRQLVEAYGENGFYEGGLSVRTTVSPHMQEIADRVLRKGLIDYDKRRGWHGPLAHIEIAEDTDWLSVLENFDPGFDLQDWQLGIVLDNQGSAANIGLADGREIEVKLEHLSWARQRDDEDKRLPAPKDVSEVLAVGDIVPALWFPDENLESGGIWGIRQRPIVDGALVAMNPHTGRILAMSGGFSFRQSKFNRATQAKRQPGSAFKPFVYLAAMEDGLTPATIELDAPLVIDQGPDLPKWKPANYTEKFYGPSTLRLGVEKSRNLMTVRLAQRIGMGDVLDIAQRFEIADRLTPNLASSLGSNEVDLLTLTTAYAMLVNGGKKLEPALIERIQDRFGKTIMRRDDRLCVGCRKIVWDHSKPPSIPDMRPPVTDPRHAYQMVHILEGVIDRGTGVRAREIGKPLAGKTGTTNDSRDAWFIGFSADLVVGVYVGFDQPRSLGKKESGSSVALPIWIDFMREALADQPATPFRTPPGIRLVRIDADTGLLPGDGTKLVIAEAFLPGTEPNQRSGSASARTIAAPVGGLPGGASEPTGTTTRVQENTGGTSGLY